MKLLGSSRFRWGLAAGAVASWVLVRRGKGHKFVKAGGPGVPKPIRRHGRLTFRGNR